MSTILHLYQHLQIVFFLNCSYSSVHYNTPKSITGHGALILLLSKLNAIVFLFRQPKAARMSNLQQQRMVVEQLRREANIKRISVSQAVEDIKVGWLVTMKTMLIALFRSLWWRASVQTASCWASPAREGTRTGRSPGLARLSRIPGSALFFCVSFVLGLKIAFMSCLLGLEIADARICLRVILFTVNVKW